MPSSEGREQTLEKALCLVIDAAQRQGLYDGSTLALGKTKCPHCNRLIPDELVGRDD